jgi:outer membrane protein assembly factor BamB
VTLAPPGPIPGYLLIADRGNNRMLLVDSKKRIFWRYPKTRMRPSMPFRFGDDTFFAPSTDRIISNQEDQQTIQIVSFPGGRVLWRYGRIDIPSSRPGYLHTPDDAYLLPNGIVTVADAYNCRVLFISPAHRIVRQYGTTGVCRHNPPRELGPINGATPLPNGGTLVSEIKGSWVDDIGPNGRLRWAVQAPVSYPSDPQLLGPNRILLADYARPGHAVLMTRTGRVLWRYGPASGPGELDHPSLATRIAPGLIAVSDDYRHRVVLISMRTKRIVWQYGHTDVAGRRPGYLNTPDGLDLLRTAAAERRLAVRSLLSAKRLSAHVSVPTPGRKRITVRAAPYRLPAPVQREVAVAAGGRVLIAGGLDAADRSTSGVFRLDPSSGHLTSLGSMPQAFHDATGALLGQRLFVFGGGAAQSSASVQQFDLRTRRGAIASHLPHALSDLSSATVGNSVYLVGGYDGRIPRREIYRTSDGRHFALAGRLPVGLRYAAVAAVGTSLVVAGGISSSGATKAVYAFDPASGRSRLLGWLPDAIGHASAVTLGGTVYVIGGADANGTVGDVTAINVGNGTIKPVPAVARVSDAAAVVLGVRALIIGGAANGRAVATIRGLR